MRELEKKKKGQVSIKHLVNKVIEAKAAFNDRNDITIKKSQNDVGGQRLLLTIGTI